MEFVDGMNLRNLLESLRRQNRRLDLARALFIMMEVCKGLGYAHDMSNPEDGKPLGIVHRDVSPPNILLSKMGEVKLVDFGLAKAASQLEQTDPGVVKGKFSYLSPEAASGLEVDYRTDIFACGILLFEMLTGRRLFLGETDYQTVELVRQARVPSLSMLNPEVPAELDQIVHRALARDPEQRFQHAYELQDTLAQLLFSRGLKVTNRDVARLVRECSAEHKQTAPATVQSGSVIDALIQEEIFKFTSLDNMASDEPTGAKPLSPNMIGEAIGPLDPKDFIDPRVWTNEFIVSDPSKNTKPQSAISRDAAAIPEVASLEQMLEGGEGALITTASLPTPAKKTHLWKSLLIALVLFIILGATAVFILHSFGILQSGGTNDNQDIIIQSE
jgi:serine/threonine-protein kinase